MRRRTFLTLGNEGIKASESMSCDVCLYNKTTQKLLIVEASKISASEYPSSNYSPVGVVVVPGSHDVYGDGSCAVMSLKEMNCDTPNTGSINYQTIVWGNYMGNISSLTDYKGACYVGSDGTVNKEVQGVASSANLPSDNFNAVQNPYDKDTYYYTYRYNDYYAPSPYNNNDTRNSAYYQTSSPSSTSNVLSDFNGKNNTKILCNLATAQSDWKTASTIKNNSNGNYYPAACCCWRFKPSGTKQGDWYLPAMGELGYIIPKMKKINKTIQTLISIYGSNIGVNLNVTNYYWSSSEQDTYYSNLIGMTYGNLSVNYKENGLNVRAFLRVK